MNQSESVTAFVLAHNKNHHLIQGYLGIGTYGGCGSFLKKYPTWPLVYLGHFCPCCVLLWSNLPSKGISNASKAPDHALGENAYKPSKQARLGSSLVLMALTPCLQASSADQPCLSAQLTLSYELVHKGGACSSSRYKRLTS